MQIYRLDSSQSPYHAGILFKLPSGTHKQVTFHSKTVVSDPVAMGKKCVTALIDDLLKSGLTDDIDRMNITSAVAAVAHHVSEFNRALVARERAHETRATRH